MRKIIGFSFWILFTAMSLALFTQCTDDNDNPQPQDLIEVDRTYGYTQVNLGICQNNINNLPSEALSTEEEAGILFMREEEKMARDFYLNMYQKWNALIFNNISASEETHFAAMLMLINKYGLTDPAANNAVGEFTDTTLQGLYTDLIAQGETSLAEALSAGAVIEEVDILDLENQLDNLVDNQDLTLVYTNLLAASKNHLKAAVKNLQTQGVTYVPLYLTQEAYDDIINSDWDHGHHGG